MGLPLDKYDLLAEFIRELEEEGYQFGVDIHLQIQELLSRLPEDTPAIQLPQYFVPLLATDAHEQQFFHDLFAKCLATLGDKRELAGPPEAPPEIIRSLRGWRWVVGISGSLLVVLLGWWISGSIEGTAPATGQESLYFSFQVVAGQSHLECPDTLRLKNFGPAVEALLCDSLNSGKSSLGFFQIDSSGCLLYSALDSIGQDSVCVLYRDMSGAIQPVVFYPSVIPAPTSTEFATQTGDVIPLPFPHDLRPFILQPEAEWTLFLARYGAWLKIAFSMLLGLLLWGVIQARERKRRKLVAELQSGKKPPYLLNIHLEGEEIELNEQFFLALQHMRRRQSDDVERLDIDRTIDATVQKAGLIELRFERQTRPPEYLLLIDRSSANNHRAKFYDWLFQTFRANEVLVERFFFDGDLRRLWNEAHPDGWTLPELTHRYSQSRLIVLGAGYSLLSAVSGKLAGWTSVFRQWKQRALLSPQPIRSWGKRENQLEELFTVLPASLQGLNLMIDQFEAKEEGAPVGWQEIIKDAAREPIELRGGLLDTLRYYFDGPLVKWIAACAVYPHLHWDLTLFIGRLLSTEEHNLVTVGNLLELTRLPWMVDGKIPIQARSVLLDFLEREDPDLLGRVRKELHHLLQQQAPPPGQSVAYDEYLMQVALNEWLITQNAARKKELEAQIANLLESGIEADLTVVRYLDRPQRPLDFIVPDNWKKYIYQSSYQGLGWRRVFKEILFWGFPLWIAGSLTAWVWPLSQQSQCEQAIQFAEEGQSLAICLDKPEARLLWQERLALQSIDSGYHDRVDSLYQEMRPDTATAITFKEIQANLATAYYNKGVPLYSVFVSGDSRQTARDSACFFFERAAGFDSTALALQNVRIWCGQEQDITATIAPLSLRFQFRANNRDLAEITISGGAPPYKLELQNQQRLMVWERAPSANAAFLLDIKAYRDTPGNYQLFVTDDLGYKAVANIPIDPKVAPEINLKGQVVDSEGLPLQGVHLYWNGDDTSIKTGANGRFELSRIFQPNADSITFSLGSYQSRTLSVATLQQQQVVRLNAIETVPPPVIRPPQDDPPPPPVIPGMVFVAGGSFTMGCTSDQGSDCDSDENPPRQIEIDNFYIGQYEVTNEEYCSFLNEKGNREEGGVTWLNLDNSYVRIEKKGDVFFPREGFERYPVVAVSWYGANAYCTWMSEKNNGRYRLPAEAEWAYAARGGRGGKNQKFSNSDVPEEIAWVKSNAGGNTRPVGGKKPNELGVFDMSGNVWEWCSDWYGEYGANPGGPSIGTTRVRRGGSWRDDSREVRVANRSSSPPSSRFDYLGFRIARNP